ncbi:Type-1 restriction enzyme R protein [Stieleria bergensis]|uniref:Type-1 restriction enzyme R protein n=1 Tax=Stieleria bergensis TaxID=2528025 RepID=A0A517SWR8_9BACT|nr:Type-1 restriction enzyme R protein [Planctomycetes bacterium SV_7m_r]
MPQAKYADYSERDICTKLITPALLAAGWTQEQFREEVKLTAGRVVVRGNKATRLEGRDEEGGPKFADYMLYANPQTPLASIEAKRNKYPVGHGMQQGLGYAERVDAPFAFSSNGDGFLMHDRTGLGEVIEREIGLDEFPTYEELWAKYLQWKGWDTEESLSLIQQPNHDDGSGREPRYYQQVAINRAIEAVAKGQDRMMLVMATGTGKTYTAFQIIWRLWKAKAKKRILFLADRNILVDQTMLQDFAPFGDVMHKIQNREAKKNYEIYLSLYQAVTGNDETKQIFRQFPPDFFDLIIVDECHRGSANEDSAWRTILEYFGSATQIGLTATPKEKAAERDDEGKRQVHDPEFNYKYFGEPIYTYSLKQGIEDGFLAPYKVIRIVSDVDAIGFRPTPGQTDRAGQVIEDREFFSTDFDRQMVLTKRTEFVARKVWQYMQATDPMSKTIIFCDDQPHAERMRQAMVNLIPEAASNRRYVVRITGDDREGKDQLGYFIDPDEPYPVVATTSKLLTTGVDAKTCKLIVLDQTINSMTEFKQIVGRGTRINEDHDKLFFTIMDFKGATRLFADPDFDGEPVTIYEPGPDDDIVPPDDEDSDEDETEDDTDEGDGEADDSDDPDDDDDTGGDPPPPPRQRYVVDDHDVGDGITQTRYLDGSGQLRTTEYRVHLRDEIKRCLLHEYAQLEDFISRWTSAQRKRAVLTELADVGIQMDSLYEAVPGSAEMDVLDLLLHIVWDQKPLTRRERADRVRKRNYFAKYGDDARAVLEALLDKYAENGIVDIEDAKILELPPFTGFGTKTQIRREIFGGNDEYSAALTDLEKALYEPDDSTAA